LFHANTLGAIAKRDETVFDNTTTSDVNGRTDAFRISSRRCVCFTEIAFQDWVQDRQPFESPNTMLDHMKVGMHCITFFDCRNHRLLRTAVFHYR
jgi:hypothetical protein